MKNATEFKTTRGGEGYAEYTVTDLTNGKTAFISHPDCGWVVFGGAWYSQWESDPFEMKRDAVESAQNTLMSMRSN